MRPFLAHTKYTRGCPAALLRSVRAVCAAPTSIADIRSILSVIQAEFQSDHYIISVTSNIRLSRLISAREVYARRLASCGSMATLVASVFRSLGIPTKLIHGRYVERNPNMRHGWNEIFVPSLRRFVAFDVTRRAFALSPFHMREGEYADWSELAELTEEASGTSQ